jgi:tetraacyldisaccharide 4'-kinase
MQLKAPAFWESSGPLAWVLLPLSLLYAAITCVRSLLFRFGLLKSLSLPVPIIFVGNLRAGGTGKTPMVIAIARALQQRGMKPGIISRGYLSKLPRNHTQEVFASDAADAVGDEPLVVKKQVGPAIPVWIGANRHQAGTALLHAYPDCDVIISDDGLQHLALQREPARHHGRDLEIVVRDNRGEGNGFLLPAGPLRASTQSPRDLTFQVKINAPSSSDTALPGEFLAKDHFLIHCEMLDAYQLIDPSKRRPLASFSAHPVLAVAGIANPNKFFTPLNELGIRYTPLALGDHADYTNIRFANYSADNQELILMTEKDAVKCSYMNDPLIWVVPLQGNLPDACVDQMIQVLNRPPMSSNSEV